MSKPSFSIILFASFLLVNNESIAAEEEILSLDRSITRNLQLPFPNDDNIYPSKSDSEIINYVLMSSESGER